MCMGSKQDLVCTVSSFLSKGKIWDAGRHLSWMCCYWHGRGNVTYTEPFKPRHRWRNVWIVGSEGLPTPSGQPVFPWTLLTGHQPRRRAMGLLPQHSNADFALLLYPSLHQHQPKTITSNPFTWQKASRETWAAVQPQDLCDREEKETRALSALHHAWPTVSV